jgi:hypothetical protein
LDPPGWDREKSDQSRCKFGRRNRRAGVRIPDEAEQKIGTMALRIFVRTPNPVARSSKAEKARPVTNSVTVFGNLIEELLTAPF